MSSVQVLHRDENGSETLVAVIDGDLIKSRSKTIRDLIATREPAIIQKITLSGPTFEALRFVLDKITEADTNKKALQITLGSRGLAQSLHIHRTILCMQIEPEQPKVPIHINGYLAHNIVSASELLAVHDAYASIENVHGKLYITMIATTAWKYANNQLSPVRNKQLKTAALTHANLDLALGVRVNEVREKVRVREIIAKKKAEKEEKRRVAAAAAVAAWAGKTGW